MKAVAINENTWYFSEAVGRAFLFKGNQAALLVDSTNGPGDLKNEVKKLVGNLPIILVNTHADSDHIGCNDQFETAYMHPSEFAYYEQKRKENYAKPMALFEGDLIDIGGRIFEPILMPGHTYGSIVLLNRKERFLVGGDTILQKVFIFGPQRNLRALIASLKKLQSQYLDEFDYILTAHQELKLDKNFIKKEQKAAEELLAGNLIPEEAGNIPLEAPEYLPASQYIFGESAFFDYTNRKY